MKSSGDSRTPGKLRRKPPRPEALLDTVRTLAAVTSNVVFTDHAQERMSERDVSALDVYRVLRSGRLVGPIAPGRGAGDWKCKIVDSFEGRARSAW